VGGDDAGDRRLQRTHELRGLDVAERLPSVHVLTHLSQRDLDYVAAGLPAERIESNPGHPGPGLGLDPEMPLRIVVAVGAKPVTPNL
jgi:hypothetical protein